MLSSIFISFGISVVLNLLFFLIAFMIKSDIFTDICYASTFLLTTIMAIFLNKSYNTSSYLLLALVLLWSIRLGSFLMIRIWKNKVDHRFDKMRNSFIKFGTFWFLQAITVWIVNMPTYIFMASKFNEFNNFSILFFTLALLFLFYETTADLQKLKWNKKNYGKFIKNGLWKNSRHPNYFGEYSFWWMIFAFILVNDYENIKLIGMIGPFYITLTLYKISGLPLLEKYSFKKFGHDEKYLEYINSTPTIIPFIGKKGMKEKWKIYVDR